MASEMTESVVPEMEPAELQVVDFETLARELEVPQETLQVLACTQEGGLVVSKFAEFVASKNEAIEEYETTIREVTDSMDVQTRKSEINYCKIQAQMPSELLNNCLFIDLCSNL